MSRIFRLLMNSTFYDPNEGLGDTDTMVDEDYGENYLHEEHLWLLIIDLLVFAALTFTAYTSSKKMESEAVNPEDFRPKFIKGLIYANGSKFCLYLRYP